MEFEIGKKYTGKNSEGKPFLIQITKKNPETGRYYFKILKGNTSIVCSDFDGDSLFAEHLKPYEDLPRICYVLGGEDTPLKPFEKFSISGVGNNLFHFNDDVSHFYDSIGDNADFYLPFIINYPEKIIRSPQFSDDEEALMRLLVKNGLPYVARDKNKALFAYPAKPVMGIDNGQFYCPDDLAQMPNKLFPYITFGNSPFDAKAYLESEAKNDG